MRADRLEGIKPMRNMQTPNEIIRLDDHAEVILYNNKSVEVARVKISLSSIEKVGRYKWSLFRSPAGDYAVSRPDKTKPLLRMHRYIMDARSEEIVDHRNGDGLDNRDNNLRVCTRSQNSQNAKLSKANTSGVKGVYYVKCRSEWIAVIHYRRRRIFLGGFKTKQEAIKARQEGEVKYFGEFRRIDINDQ
jgi:hypothetical protein